MKNDGVNPLASQEKNMNRPLGYYQHPALWGDSVFFVAEGDIWEAPFSLSEGSAPLTAHRLTAGLGAVTSLTVSPDGQTLFFVSLQEGGEELYRLCRETGRSERMTYLGGDKEVLSWSHNGKLFLRSNHETPFECVYQIYAFDPVSHTLDLIPCGPANFINEAKTAEGNQCVLGRHGYGYLSWKRYRGGTAGEIWVEAEKENWVSLFPSLKSNLLRPTWVGERLYFLSDHEARGALYSSTPRGGDLKCHTHFKDFYVRDLATDGKRLVYTKGGDLWVYLPKEDRNVCVSPVFPSIGPKRARKFVSPADHLSAHNLSPNGQNLVLTARGRLFFGSPFRGPMVQLGKRHGVRYRLGAWMDDEHVVAICDCGTYEQIEIFCCKTLEEHTLKGDWGRVLSLQVAPDASFVVLANHMHTLLKVDLKDGTCAQIDQSNFGGYAGIDISSDGRFVVYAWPRAHDMHELRLFCVEKKVVHTLTEPVLGDTCPVFDPKGRYLYFLSERMYHGEEKSVRPYLLTLHPHTLSPFVLPEEKEEEHKEEKKAGETQERVKNVMWALCAEDIVRIKERCLPFPVREDVYHGLYATEERVFFLKESEQGIEESAISKDGGQGCDLWSFELNTLKTDLFTEDVRDVRLSRKGEWLSLVSDNRHVRVLRTTEKPEEDDSSFRSGGWVDFERIALEVDPPEEWRFMFTEAWRLQKELFWDPKMVTIDWDAVKVLYEPLLTRVRTSAELMDLIGEMQGELGHSHAYVWGYDRGAGAGYNLGFLGANFVYDAQEGVWVLDTFLCPHVVRAEYQSPLRAPGVLMKEGDQLLAIDGHKLSVARSPGHCLIEKAGRLVSLLVREQKTGTVRHVRVKPARSLRQTFYENFVEQNRAHVHVASKGKVGYLHIPDMAEEGLQAFFTAYAHEFDRDALIIDVRFNRGGMVSSQILSQLLRKRLGYDQSRHEGQVPYMLGAPRGPMVALCNEYTASDGDMFAYSFKRMKMGPLIGKRTWGGVVGIFPKHPLLDGSWTSQPEYAIWFHDIGWKLENEGAEPDVFVEIPPGEKNIFAWPAEDPQLLRGIEAALALI